MTTEQLTNIENVRNMSHSLYNSQRNIVFGFILSELIKDCDHKYSDNGSAIKNGFCKICLKSDL